MMTKDLIVHVIGISGKCSSDYIGCGKSCLCRQFVYNEYKEESYSTLLQTEFNSQAINQQHTIYWGQKGQTYNASINKSDVSVDFKVFEHTNFYQDGINKPFHGYDNYEDRIFTHHDKFLNKCAFRSRNDILDLEESRKDKFLVPEDLDIPVAYMYVVDVSQSCFVFEAQMQLMSRLLKSIQRNHCCVVVASKFDTHCKANVKFLESFADGINVKVIKCSSKYGENVDTAFECLAMEALSLNNTVPAMHDVNHPHHTILDYHTDKKRHTQAHSTSLNSLQQLSVRSVSHFHYDELSCAQSKSDKKIKKGSRLSSAFSKILFSRKTSKVPKHHITMPATYLKTDDRRILGHSGEHMHTASSYPDLTNVIPRSKSVSYHLSGSGDAQHSDSKPTTEELFPVHLQDQTNCKQQRRSAMPLPLTPLEVMTLRGSVSNSTSSSSITSRVKEVSISPTLSTTFVESSDVAAKNDMVKKTDYDEIHHLVLQKLPNGPTASESDSVHELDEDYVISDHEFKQMQSDARLIMDGPLPDHLQDPTNHKQQPRSAMPLPPTPLELVMSKGSELVSSSLSVNSVTSTNTEVKEISPSPTLSIPFVDSPDMATSLSAENDQHIDNSVDYEPIIDYQHLQQWLDSDTVIGETSKTSGSKTSGEPLLLITHEQTTLGIDETIELDEDYVISEQEFKQMEQAEYLTIVPDSRKHTDNQINVDNDTIISECIECTAHVVRSKEVSKLKNLDSDMSDYVLMHKATCPFLQKQSLVDTYDHLDSLYEQMLSRCYHSGDVPPRNIKRAGNKSLLNISSTIKARDATYVNISRSTTLLPPRHCHSNDSVKPDAMLAISKKNIPRSQSYQITLSSYS